MNNTGLPTLVLVPALDLGALDHGPYPAHPGPATCIGGSAAAIVAAAVGADALQAPADLTPASSGCGLGHGPGRQSCSLLLRRHVPVALQAACRLRAKACALLLPPDPAKA